MKLRALLLSGTALAVIAASVIAQEFGLEKKEKSFVTYISEPQTISAGKRSGLELNFRVQDGFHVNSHTPKSEILIPTKLTIDPADTVKLYEAQYPAGTSYSFSFDPSEKLDVYSGPFTVKLPVTAGVGPHSLHGSLHYQACDHAACYPPKTLPIEIPFTAK